MKVNGNDMYHPTPIAGGDGSVVSLDYVSGTQQGVNLRTQIAAMVLQGMCSNEHSEYTPYATLAKNAVQCADALINQLNEPEE